jgi:putative addiction module CopG family antidote
MKEIGMAIEVHLPIALDAFVRGRVRDGVYSNGGEVIADAVRRLASDGLGVFDDKALREAIEEGLNSAWNVDALLAELDVAIAAQADKAA